MSAAMLRSKFESFREITGINLKNFDSQVKEKMATVFSNQKSALSRILDYSQKVNQYYFINYKEKKLEIEKIDKKQMDILTLGSSIEDQLSQDKKF